MIDLYTERMQNLGPCNNVNYLHGLNDLCLKYVHNSSTILELGTNDGISTALFATYAKTVFAVDLLISDRLLATLKQYPNISFVKSNFHQILPLIQNNSFDLIYIDGHHDTFNIKQDIKNSILKLKNNGTLAGHDYNQQYGQDVINYINDIVYLNNINNLSVFSDSSWSFTVQNTQTLILP